MSYDIIRGIKVDEKEGTVTVKAASNNVYPKDFTWFTSPSLSRILKEDGREALDKVMLKEFWGGNFQGGESLYNKSVKYCSANLPHVWGNVGKAEDVGTEKYGEKVLYTYDQLTQALYDNYLLFKKRKFGKFRIKYDDFSYIKKITTKFIIPTASKEHAKIFKSFEEAVIYARKTFPNDKAHNQVEEIK
jgi:hypothetical protein